MIGGIPRYRASLRTLGPLIALVVAGAGAAAPEMPPVPSFAAPGSGHKVASYEVELPLNDTGAETATIPGDCANAMRLLAGGRASTSNVVERRIWFKVESDCRYHGLINRHGQSVIADHVSGFDFFNARIDALPVDPRCATGRCNPRETDRLGRLRYFPLAEPLDPELAASGRATCGNCRLENGLFRGRLFIDTDGQVRCENGTPRPSVRLLSVDYADVNGDRVMDAVLRFVLLERGASRMPMVMALTREAPTGPFVQPPPLR